MATKKPIKNASASITRAQAALATAVANVVVAAGKQNSRRKWKAMRQRQEAEHKRYVREHRAEARATLALTDPTPEALLECCDWFPKETLAHPILPILSLSNASEWALIRHDAYRRLLRPRLDGALRSLSLAQHQRLGLLAAQRALPLFQALSLGPRAEELVRLLRRLEKGEMTRTQTSTFVVTFDTTIPGKTFATSSALWHLAQALMLPSDRKKQQTTRIKKRARRLRRPVREFRMPTWESRQLLRHLVMMRGGGEYEDLKNPVGALEELGWQTLAAEAIRDGKRVPKTWKAPHHR